MTDEFKNITRPMRNKYLIFLGVILITIITNQIIIRFNIQKNHEAATIINVAGRQRMLSQRISKLIYNISGQLHETGAANPASLDSLAIFSHQFSLAHQALSTGNGTLSITTPPSPRVKQMLQNNSNHLINITAAAAKVIKTPDIKTANLAVETMRQNDVQFLLIMESVLATLETEYSEDQHTINNILVTLTTIAIVAIILSFVFIFLPAIRKLRTSKELLVKTTDRLFMATGTAQIGIWEYEVSEDKLIWDDEMYKLYNISPQDLRGVLKAWFKTIHHDDVPMVVKNLRKTLHGKGDIDSEFRIVWPDGTIRHIKAQAVSQYNRHGKVVRLTGTNHDITDQRVAERELKESNESLAKAQEIAKMGSWEWDIKTGKENWSDEQFRIFGLEPQEVAASYNLFVNALHPDDEERVLKAIDNALKGIKSYEEEFRIITKKGETKHIEARGEVLLDAAGVPKKMIGTVLDITEKVLLQKDKASIETILQETSKVAQIGTWELDMATNRLIWDDMTRQIHEVPDDYEVGLEHGMMFLKNESDKEKIQAAIIDTIQNGTSYDMELELITAKGNPIWVRAINRSEFENGKCKRLYGLLQNITKQKSIEIELKLNEEQFRGAFEYSAIGMALVSLDGKWLRANKQVFSIVGYTETELLNLTFQDITHPEDLDTDLEYLGQLLAGDIDHYQMEKRYIHKNKSIVWVLLSVSLVRDITGNPVHLIAQIEDITQRKNNEQELLRANQELTALSDSGNYVSTISTDLNGIITYFSKGAETLLGYTAEEMVGKQSPAIIHKREEVEQRGDELTKKFGREIRGFDVFIEYARQGQFESREWTYVKKNGDTFPVQLVITSIKNLQGDITGFLGIATDISWQKDKETELMASLDIIGEQNKRLLNFAHIVSHNLRSHSGNISMVLGLYDDSETPEEKDEMVEHLKGISSGLSETIKNLNEVVSIQTNAKIQRENINLKNYIAKTIDVLSGEISTKGGEVINNVPDDIEVEFNPSYMESVLLNFITNGLKYRHPDRNPVVTLDTMFINDKLVLQITDNGLGIDMDKHGDKLFGMYKTFHGNSDAKGIGLFITKNQVESMGGKIEVESEVNKGTRFKIFLQ